ncbi:hypothetical protein D3C84_628620 [compost metagenome]
MRTFCVVDQLPGQGRVTQQRADLAGEGGTVGGRGQQAVVAVLQDIGNPADAEGHHRHPGLHRFEQNHGRAFGARADHQRIELSPPGAHVGLVARQRDTRLQSRFVYARLQAFALRPVAEHHRVQLRVLLTQRDQRIEKQVRAFFATQAPDVTSQPALTLATVRQQVVGRRQAIGDHLQFVRAHIGLTVQRGNAFGDTHHPVHRGRAAQLQAQPGVELLLATARGEAVLGDHQWQAQQRGADPAEQQALEVVRIDQWPLVPSLAQMPQQRDQACTAEAIDTGLAKSRDQFWRRIEKQHLVLPRRRQAMIQQHPLGPIEAAAAEQMNDRQVVGGAERRVQLRTQCTRAGTLQLLCGLFGRVL